MALSITARSHTALNVPGASGTAAYGISGNNIVGYYGDVSGTHGFVYNGTSYTALNVPGTSFTAAYGISGNSIVGYYTDTSGHDHGFLATPSVPIPSALWLLGPGLVGLAAVRRRFGK